MLMGAELEQQLLEHLYQATVFTKNVGCSVEVKRLYMKGPLED